MYITAIAPELRAKARTNKVCTGLFTCIAGKPVLDKGHIDGVYSAFAMVGQLV